MDLLFERDEILPGTGVGSPISEHESDIEEVSEEEEPEEVKDRDDNDEGSGRESRDDDKSAGVWMVLTS